MVFFIDLHQARRFVPRTLDVRTKHHPLNKTLKTAHKTVCRTARKNGADKPYHRETKSAHRSALIRTCTPRLRDPEGLDATVTGPEIATESEIAPIHWAESRSSELVKQIGEPNNHILSTADRKTLGSGFRKDSNFGGRLERGNEPLNVGFTLLIDQC